MSCKWKYCLFQEFLLLCFEDSANNFNEDFDINSLVKNAEDFSEEYYFDKNLDHFSPFAAHEFVNKIYQDLKVKHGKRI